MRDKLHALDNGTKGGTLRVKSTHVKRGQILWRSNYGKRIFMFKRRLGQNGKLACSLGHNCPQILEMEDGDFAAVGPDITVKARGGLPPGPGIGPEECVVKVPREVMLAAMSDMLATA